MSLTYVHLCSLCLPSPFEHISQYPDKSPEKKEEIVMSPTLFVPLHAERRTTLRPLAGGHPPCSEPQTKVSVTILEEWGMVPVRPQATGAVGCRRKEVE